MANMNNKKRQEGRNAGLVAGKLCKGEKGVGGFTILGGNEVALIVEVPEKGRMR